MNITAWLTDAIVTMGIPLEYRAHVAVVLAAACIALIWLWMPKRFHVTDRQLEVVRDRIEKEGLPGALRPPPMSGSERVYVAIAGGLALACFGLAVLGFLAI